MKRANVRSDFLATVVFSAGFVGTAYWGTFVYLSVFLYGGRSIVGYVPAGITGVTNTLTSILLLGVVLLVFAYRRSSGSYLIAGCVGVPLGVVVPALLAGLGARALGLPPTDAIAVTTVITVGCVVVVLASGWRLLRRSEA